MSSTRSRKQKKSSGAEAAGDPNPPSAPDGLSSSSSSSHSFSSSSSAFSVSWRGWSSVVWHRLPCEVGGVNLQAVLLGGQAFQWQRVESNTDAPTRYLGVLDRRLFALQQHASGLVEYTLIAARTKLAKNKPDCDSMNVDIGKQASSEFDVNDSELDADSTAAFPDSESCLSDYFRLNFQPPLSALYSQWGKCDEQFAALTQRGNFSGIRLLRQNPFESLISFVCSSNNSIVRITKMLQSLRQTYGQIIATDVCGQDFYTFPTLSVLRQVSEQSLRAMGFGYRAKYVVGTVAMLHEKGGYGWLNGLRNSNDDDAKQTALTALPGIGRKVAACIALTSLDGLSLIPVDTHVWQISSRLFHKELRLTSAQRSSKGKALTPGMYQQIVDAFRQRFGPLCGWAQSILFTADLKQFSQQHRDSDELTNHKQLEKLPKKPRKSKQHKRNAAELEQQPLDAEGDKDVVDSAADRRGNDNGQGQEGQSKKAAEGGNSSSSAAECSTSTSRSKRRKLSRTK